MVPVFDSNLLGCSYYFHQGLFECARCMYGDLSISASDMRPGREEFEPWKVKLSMCS